MAYIDGFLAAVPTANKDTYKIHAEKAFEGIIPEGEYGGGTVMLWDQGKWSAIKGKNVNDLEQGHFHFILDGERMRGEWLLVRMRGKKGDKRKNWLLRKLEDEYTGNSDDLVTREITSIASGRSMAEIATATSAEFSLPGRKRKAIEEIAKLDRKGNPDFSALQKTLKNSDNGLILFASFIWGWKWLFSLFTFRRHPV